MVYVVALVGESRIFSSWVPFSCLVHFPSCPSYCYGLRCWGAASCLLQPFLAC